LKNFIRRALDVVSAGFPLETDEPIRAELFSIERLEQHAESLAKAQRVTTKRGAGRGLAQRLRENERILLAAYRATAKATREERAITPAAEWLIDNFYVAQEQIREVREDLPHGFYRALPKLAEGRLTGYPRVFGVAWAFIAHTDSRFDPEMLCRFVQAYQRVQPLTIGELWAVAITLRIVLVENLRRAAERIVSERAARQAANALADQLLDPGSIETEAPEIALRRFNRRPVPRAFAVQLVQRLRDQDPKVTPALRWLDERLASMGTSADEAVRIEHQLQGAMNVTVRNVITSMRMISAVDWAEFFETVSLVDGALRAGSDFAEMDFPTRDRYRHAIEELARRSGEAELEIAHRAVADAKHAAELRSSDFEMAGSEREPGYYLISNGRSVLEKEIGFRVPISEWLARANATVGILGYVSAIAVIGVFVLVLALFGVAEFGVSGWTLFLLAVLGVLPASDAAVSLVNRGVTKAFGAKTLPAMELLHGVPADLRTIIVVPTLLTTRAELEKQIERLEVHHLASQDGDLRFAILSDWTDSIAEHAPDDDQLLGAASEGIARLNQRYASKSEGVRFFLFHRRRIWNEGQGKWIGWERKRGKLHEFNRLLRGATDTTFVAIDGSSPLAPAGVRYVITLDADTWLPRGTAKRLIGKMAHPLNRPRLDPKKNRIVEGYAVLQPRVTPSLPSGREGSLFQRIFTSPSGLDPYAFAVSDVYQDLFGEGSYSGKGIYDVDAFEAALAGRLPESSILSHDLLEGIFARAGLASDVEVVEEFPSRYAVAAARQHRWARGDWQLLPWIFGRGSDSSDDRQKAAIPLIGRWKMLDNLRRTVSAPAAFVALLAGWTLPMVAAAVWSGFVVATFAIPTLFPALIGMVPRRRGLSQRRHWRAVGVDFGLSVSQIGLLVTLLAHQAWLMTDAIVRTFFRLFVRHQRLLEWVTAAQSKLSTQLTLGGYYQWMGGGIALTGAAVVVVLCSGHRAWPVAAPFVILWMAAPAIARWASFSPAMAGAKPISDTDARALRVIARRTWRFFETFVTADDHMLPPDNFQEDPQPVLAHRTSPTNLGLYLLSIVAAHDFGWSGKIETVERMETTLQTMHGMERFRGHFYNWYDTHDLRALEPKYISSVDSGNLAGHLIVLRNACREMVAAPVTGLGWLSGIEDALELTRDSLHGLSDDRRTLTVTQKDLEDALNDLSTASSASHEPAGGSGLLSETPHSSHPSSAGTPTSPARLVGRLAELAKHTDTLVDIARAFTAERCDESSAEVLACASAVNVSVRSHQRDLDELMPWAKLIAAEAALAGPADVATDSSPERALARFFDSVPTLADLPNRCEEAVIILAALVKESALPTNGASDLLNLRVEILVDALKRSANAARSFRRRLEALSELTKKMFDAMEFGFLFNQTRQLLTIGYRVADNSLDSNCYDLLASEARLASFVAIAKGDVPTRHWFKLGRTETPVGSGSTLVSWSGSMFEYLMPSLVMRAPAGSLLEQSNRCVVQRQIEYGAELDVPWGVSESAYNVRDLELTYQYSSFGVPGLGLKRGLNQDAVIAPYATALATMIDPHAAVQNFSQLAAAGGRGRYGWYEALDYTPARLPEGDSVAIVRSYMAHHQGMTLIAICDALQNGTMRNRFHAEPIIQATQLLLQERIPRDVLVAYPRADEVAVASNVRELVPPMPRRFLSPHQSVPRTHLLSNGRYAVMTTSAGSGYSRWNDSTITRWREDATCDSWGTYIYLRDVRSGDVWSAGYQPTGVEPDSYTATFFEDRVEIVRRDKTLETKMEIAVSPEDDSEVRRVSISNLGPGVREIELTSYAEVVLAPDAADATHPAFSSLFVQTEYVSDVGAILATRRLPSPSDPQIWAAHIAVVEGEVVGSTQFETDRARFIGRGRGIRTPLSVIDGRPLSNTIGAVLDPIFSLRRRIRLVPGATARIAFWTLVGSSRSEVLDLADKHHDPVAFERAITLAWTQAQVQLYHLGIDSDEANLFQRLAGHVLYSNAALRPSSTMLQRSAGGPSSLWAYAISGDLPIVLVRIADFEGLDTVRQLLRAHQYWRMKQLAVDLVILNENPPSYAQDLQSALETMVRASQSHQPAGKESTRGGVFILRDDLVSPQSRNLLQSAARAVIWYRRGSLFQQVKRLEVSPATTMALPPKRRPSTTSTIGSETAPPTLDLEFFNGLGGFAAGDGEYVTILGKGQWTPAPWMNIIANPSFGFQVSVEGAGYTWSINSQQNQITPWSNDPVSDRPGEVFYIRDEDSGELWGPTALPIREENSAYIARHGQGYSRFEHTSHGISLELLQYVPVEDAIKISRLKIHNNSRRSRRLSVTAYVEWVLGTSRSASAPYVATAIDPETGVMLAHNHWSAEFSGRVAFADLAGRQTGWTGDRTEFIGRNRTLDHPAAMEGRAPLSHRVGAGLDPCGALQTRIELAPNETTEVVFFLGEASTEREAIALITRYRDADLDAVLHAVTRRWDEVLGAVRVRTPDRAMDILLNHWLLYQTLSCRVWARAACYQASGAYGFRDQLQDVMALTVSKPEITREHLLRAAGRQFVEGDVQHWWHPPSGQGVRTRIADDRIWLAYATAHYVEVTGDVQVLDEIVPFLDGPILRDEQLESYFQPTISESQGTLFEHCARGLDQSLGLGSHGLPLIGTGDWNDGLNLVGAGGKGESIWLGWFLYAALSTFAPLAETRGEHKRAECWRQHATALAVSLEREGWDRDWYLRAFFDDGTPLGSASNSECRIDSIAQSWAVISGAADQARAATAMAALEKHLVRRNDELLLLLTPPFDQASPNPGYIKGYPPGIRENGGQYTHGAVWSVIAFAMLGDGDKAGELFSILNPISHSSTRAGIHRYKVEPYVTCGDVYAEPAHVGRGGWTWYSGSAGWMYRAGLEWILGFRLRGATLLMDPSIPKGWRNFEIVFRYRSARYVIEVENPHGVSRGVASIELDRKVLPTTNPMLIALSDDGATHQVRVVLGVPPEVGEVAPGVRRGQLQSASYK
jgi:cyclic beta-1,2-glucan synthetase